MMPSKKAGRKNCSQVDHNTGKRSIDIIGELCGDSAKQVQRYIKITELIPALLDKVDDGTMGFTTAVQLSYLKKKEQQEIMNAMDSTQCTPSLSQAIRMKKLSESGKLTEADHDFIIIDCISLTRTGERMHREWRMRFITGKISIRR